MKARIVAWAVGLTLIAGFAVAQLGNGPGIYGGISSGIEGMTNDMTVQDNIIYYNGNALLQWSTTQSTSSNYTLTSRAPSVHINFGSTSERQLQIYENGFSHNPLNLTKDQRYRIRFAITNIDAIADMGAEGVIQVTFGDTTFIDVDHTPDGFGVICAGDNEIFGGMVADDWYGFVGDGSDTTFVPLGVTVGNENQFYIEAHESGGVDFYLNGAYRATISSPSRSTNADVGGMTLWLRSDGVEFWSDLLFGPMMIQRSWD